MEGHADCKKKNIFIFRLILLIKEQKATKLWLPDFKKTTDTVLYTCCQHLVAHCIYWSVSQDTYFNPNPTKHCFDQPVRLRLPQLTAETVFASCFCSDYCTCPVNEVCRTQTQNKCIPNPVGPVGYSSGIPTMTLKKSFGMRCQHGPRLELLLS